MSVIKQEVTLNKKALQLANKKKQRHRQPTFTGNSSLTSKHTYREKQLLPLQHVQWARSSTIFFNVEK